MGPRAWLLGKWDSGKIHGPVTIRWERGVIWGTKKVTAKDAKKGREGRKERPWTQRKAAKDAKNIR
jgi:hypothetical protein